MAYIIIIILCWIIYVYFYAFVGACLFGLYFKIIFIHPATLDRTSGLENARMDNIIIVFSRFIGM